jgi:hypothetical protein
VRKCVGIIIEEWIAPQSLDRRWPHHIRSKSAVGGEIRMRDFFRVGCVSLLSLIFSGATASAQVGGSPPAGAPAGGGLQGNSSALDDAAAETREPIAKKIPAPAPARMSTFNRVTTTRKQALPSPSQPAGVSRAGSASSAATAASRAAAVRPFTPPVGSARARAATSGVPAESTWRQTPRPVRPPATATKSVTRSYYPGMRPGAHPNADIAKTRARNGLGSVQGGIGVGIGMGMSGGRSAHAARPGLTGAPPSGGRAPAAAAPRR